MSRTPATRRYRMAARAVAAARTADAILAASAALWRDLPVDEITLERVAERAGVSVRTVIRRFGSRAGLMAALIEHEGARIVADRGAAPAGDVSGALDVLLRHYERDGAAVLRTLALEDQVPEAKTIVELGRAEHRVWCARVFGPRLSEEPQAVRQRRLDALVSATDLYLWKLLRQDLARPLDEVKQVLLMLVEGVLDASPPPGRR